MTRGLDNLRINSQKKNVNFVSKTLKGKMAASLIRNHITRRMTLSVQDFFTDLWNNFLFLKDYLAILSTAGTKGRIPFKKCHKKWKKSAIFLTPPPHPHVLDLFEFGKNWKFDDPPL